MTTRVSGRVRKAPRRFEDEIFIPGANNKYTEGRDVDAGHSAKVDGDAAWVGDFRKLDEEFIVEDSVVEEVNYSGGEESDAESEEESEEESEAESECEWSSDDYDEDQRLYWGEKYPLPEDTFLYTLKDGNWSYCSYVKKIGEEYVVTLTDWLYDCPDNIDNNHEWYGNMVGKLNNCVVPNDRQNGDIIGDFVMSKGWRNVALPMGIDVNDSDSDEDEDV